MDLNLLNIICFVLIIIVAIIELILYCTVLSASEEQVDLSNTTCTESVHIARKLFFHKCLKENKTIFDIRYFWKNEEENNVLKASIIGVQMINEEFNKLCNYCNNMS